MKEEFIAALRVALKMYNEINEVNNGNIEGLEEVGMKIFEAIQIVKNCKTN